MDITKFSLSNMTAMSSKLRRIGSDASSMEQVARRVVAYFFDQLVDGEGQRSCALVRFYKTMTYESLGEAEQEFARQLLHDDSPQPLTKCLVLLATAGEVPAWNCRRNSARHKAIPLLSEETIRQAPMIAQLIHQLGLESRLLTDAARPLLVDEAERTYNVFYVPEALGSPYIPAQENFVIPHKIRSVLGVGGVLPSGNLFSLIMFSKTFIPREAADLFKPLALSLKTAILPFAAKVLD